MDRAGEQVREGYLRRLEGADLRSWIDGEGLGEKGDGEVDELVERMEREAVRPALSVSSLGADLLRRQSISDSLRIDTSIASAHSSPSPGGNSVGSARSSRLRTQAARLRSLRDESRGSGRSEASSVGGAGSSSEEVTTTVS